MTELFLLRFLLMIKITALATENQLKKLKNLQQKIYIIKLLLQLLNQIQKIEIKNQKNNL